MSLLALFVVLLAWLACMALVYWFPWGPANAKYAAYVVLTGFLILWVMQELGAWSALRGVTVG